jgi:anti-sigma B factor antagonist
MEIRHSEVNGVKILEVEGDVNMFNSQELRKVFKQLLKDKVKRLLVDLTKSNYIDSSCLATLIEMQQEMNKMDAKMCLSGVSGKVLGIFEITKMDTLFKMFPSQADALAQL